MSDPVVDTGAPSVARVWDALLGGKDNFEVDRAVAERLLALVPGGQENARADRSWQGRVLRWLAEEAGIDQYLDLGSGLPTMNNTHEVVQTVNRDCKVVYVDNDPAVMAFGRALLETDERTRFVAADLTQPDGLLGRSELTEFLDFDRPIAVMQAFTLHFVSDTARAQAIMSRYIDALAPGSYVALSHLRVPDDPADPLYAMTEDVVGRYRAVAPEVTARSSAQIAALLPGLEVLEPGVVPLHEWWPGGPRIEPVPPVAQLVAGVLGRKA